MFDINATISLSPKVLVWSTEQCLLRADEWPVQRNYTHDSRAASSSMY